MLFAAARSVATPARKLNVEGFRTYRRRRVGLETDKLGS